MKDIVPLSRVSLVRVAVSRSGRVFDINVIASLDGGEKGGGG